MNCIVCGNKIKEGEDIMLLMMCGGFMHKRCQPMWEKLLGEPQERSE